MIKKMFNTGIEEGGGGPKSVKDKVVEAGLVGVGKAPETGPPVVINENEEEETRNVLASLRRDADSLHKTAEVLSDGVRSRALSLAITAFQQARQFLGCLLKERGSKSPYTIGNDSTTAELDPKLWDPGKSFYEPDEIASPAEFIIAIKKLREKSADVITDYQVYAEAAVSRGFMEAAILPAVMVNLVQGRNWLGEVLGEKAKEKNAG